MKAWQIVLIILGTIVLLIIIGITVMFSKLKKSTDAYNSFDYSNLEISKVADGTYTGSEDGGIVKATVEVTVKGHKITKVTILSHDCGKGKPAEVIVDDIVEQNGLQVDTISGATFSSQVIKKAVYNALTKNN